MTGPFVRVDPVPAGRAEAGTTSARATSAGSDGARGAGSGGAGSAGASGAGSGGAGGAGSAGGAASGGAASVRAASVRGTSVRGADRAAVRAGLAGGGAHADGAGVRAGSAGGVGPVGAPDRAARVWRALLALVLEKNDRRRQASDALELSYIKVKALRRLASSPLSMRDLASTLASDAPYTTLVVDELERRGFAERRVNPSDRRSKLVSLTTDGQQAAALAESIMTDPPDAFRALPAGDLAHLERIVTKLGGFD